NARWARERLSALDQGSGRTVVGLQLRGMTADLVRGIGLTTLMLLLLRPAAAFVLQSWGRSDGGARAIAIGLAAVVAAAAAWKLFHAVRHARLLLAVGLALGGAVLLVQS